jgi:hypothetical protein
MYEGYLRLGGNELINAERTAAYIRHVMPEFPFRHVWPAPMLHTALGDERYNSPLVDDAEWVSAADPSTHGFFGLYPISIEGIGDSTVRASVTEHIVDGGSVGPARAASRTMRVRGMLLGVDERAVEAGLTWLRNALDPRSCDCGCRVCQGDDLRYFLAPPIACNPAWDTDDSQGDTVDLGTVDPGSSPLIFQFPVHPTMPSRAWWHTPAADGVIIRWGALERGGSRILEEHGPIHLLRSNHIPNPRLRGADDLIPASTLPGWTFSADTLAKSWDGGDWTKILQDDEPAIRTNWLPDPSFENGTPVSTGWRSSTPGGITAVVDGTAPQGAMVAVVPAVAGETQLEVSILGPALQEYINSAMLSFDVAQNDDDLVVEILDNLGTVIETHTVDASELTDPWQRVEVELFAVGINYVLRIRTAGTSELRVDGFLLDQTYATDFFDGDTADAGDVTYSYVTGSPTGASRRVDATDPFVETVITADTDASGGEAVVSVYLAAPETNAQVTVDVLDVDANVIASTTVSPPPAGQRYFIPVLEARQASVQLRSSSGEYLVGRIMLESGAEVGEYFDGNTAATVDYTVTWDALPDESPSRMTWAGSTEIIRADSDWRPVLWVDQGILRHTMLSYAIRDEIPMETQLEPIERKFHSVKAIQGPLILRRHSLDPGAAIDVEFLLVAEKPYPFSNPRTIFTNLMTADTALHADEVVNVVTNPSAETATTGYVAVPGTTGVAAVTNPVSATAFGTHVARATWSTASTAAGGGMVYGSLATLPVTPGSPYCFSVGHIKSSINNRLRVDVGYFEADGTPINTQLGAEFQVTAGLVYDVSVEGYIAPDTAAFAKITVQSVAGVGYANWSIASYLELDGIIAHFGDALVPYFDGSTADTVAYDYAWDDVVDASSSRRTFHVDSVDPLIDPDLPALPEPPVPPQIPDIAIEPIIEWRRYYIPIEAEDVSNWAVSVPVVLLTTSDDAIRQVRVQFLPNPFGRAPELLDPTTFCGEYVLSYLPAESTLTITGVVESAWAEVAQRAPEPADHLLYASDGGPVIWPELTCGVAYVMAVDVPPDLDVGTIDFDLLLYRRE